MAPINNINSSSKYQSSATASWQKATERMASGSKINRAADDAAGLAIAMELEAQAATTKKAVDNAAYGQSLADIQDAAVMNITDMNIKREELATRAANGPLNEQHRQALQQEYEQLGQEIDRTRAATKFNDQPVFNNDGVSIQVGTDSGPNSQIQSAAADTSRLNSGGNISTQDGARAAIDSVKTSIDAAAKTLGDIGAVASRLEYATQNNLTSIENEVRASSAIRDADLATESANAAAAAIRQQSALAMQAQAGKLSADMTLKLMG